MTKFDCMLNMHNIVPGYVTQSNQAEMPSDDRAIIWNGGEWYER